MGCELSPARNYEDMAHTYTAYTGLEEVMQSSLLFSSSFLTVIVAHELRVTMKNEKAMGAVTPKSQLDEGEEEHLCHIPPSRQGLNL